MEVDLKCHNFMSPKEKHTHSERVCLAPFLRNEPVGGHCFFDVNHFMTIKYSLKFTLCQDQTIKRGN